MHLKPVHAVKYVDDSADPGTLHSYDALVLGHLSQGEEAARLYVLADGEAVKVVENVPHGSAEQGVTWY